MTWRARRFEHGGGGVDMIYMETHCTDPCYNLAFEEYQLTHCTGGDLLILWQNENAVVVGLNQNTAEEINSAYVQEHQIRVVRRMTGGGAVYHDMGNLNYSFITDVCDLGAMSIAHFSERVCCALRYMGVPAEVSGKNDIVVNGKKVSGAAQRLYGKRILHHGCLLFRSDTGRIAAALRPDPFKFSSKSTKSVQSRVGNIADYLPPSLTLEDFWRQFLSLLCEGEVVPRELSRAEHSEIELLSETKYRTWEWNYGHSPAYSVSRREKFPGGILEFRADVQDGRIRSCTFFGDYMEREEAAPLKKALEGTPYTQHDIAAVLSGFELSDYFGEISLEEALSLMCP